MGVSDLDQQMALDKLDCRIRTLSDALRAPALITEQKAWEKAIAAEPRKPVASGLIVHYEFDGTLADTSGHYRHGKLPGKDATFISGTVDLSLSMRQEDTVDLTDGVFRDSREPFTLAVWVKPTHERQLWLFDKGGVQIYSSPSKAIPILKRGAYFHFDFNGIRLRTKDRVLFGPWHHFALLYDGSAKAAGFELYLNGNRRELVVEQDHALAPFSGAEPLRIREFQGQLDDLRIYARRLSAEEIAEVALHVPAARTAAIPSKKRNREDADRLREYHLTWAAAPAWRRMYAELLELQQQRESLELVVPTSMIMREMDKPRETYILARGDYRNRTGTVTPGVPSALPPLPAGAPANRLGLARWLTDPSHPLTARVTVNRFWQAFFGSGLVKTSEDFGSQGEAPSHPDLLDWLAVEFIESGWNTKALLKSIVMSATYRQSSRVTPALRERDPENRLLARMSRFRIPAESVRDNALAASGLLKPDVGGRSVFPYQPSGLWEEMAIGREFSAQWYTPSSDKDLYRRSMYTFWKRTVPPASLATFDAPDREKCTARRPVTNTPLQALVLMNDPTYIEAARHLAQRTLLEAGLTPEKRIAYAYRRVVSRPPTLRETMVLKDAARRQSAIYASDPDAARKLLGVGDSPFDPKLDPVELAAWTNVSAMILSLDEAITKE
jgi:hypothetical protein